MYPSRYRTNLEDVDELIEFRIQYTFHRQKSSAPSQGLGFQLKPKFGRKYTAVLEDKLHSHNINFFEQIGMPDPFPRENKEVYTKIPAANTDLVYDQRRLVPDSIPLTVYLPSKRLLLKIMRACVGV